MCNWKIQLATREKGLLYICVNCHLGSACAVRAGWSEMAFYYQIRFCAKIDFINTEILHKNWKCHLDSVCADCTDWSEMRVYANVKCPFPRVASHMIQCSFGVQKFNDSKKLRSRPACAIHPGFVHIKFFSTSTLLIMKFQSCLNLIW